MSIQIRFLKMDRSEAVEQFVTEELEALQHHIPRNKEAHFHVWLEYLNRNGDNGKKGFHCAVEIDGLTKKQFYAEKTDESFHRAFHECIRALNKVFRREKSAMSSRQKRARVRVQEVAS